MSIKRIVIMIGIAAITWYGLRWYMGYQTLRSAFTCAEEMDMQSQMKAVKSDDQAQALAGRLVDCMAGTIGFPASLFFDKKEVLASMKKNNGTVSLK